jgi:hypothetical protein
MENGDAITQNACRCAVHGRDNNHRLSKIRCGDNAA